ncbi:MULTISPECIES: outer membrane protein assembly factor BamE [Ramlibacter]|uniref:Outer membrane protein assembly factor BamE n=1 Tax=Ramlibacter pinisoli TaxID=2682844 RepID=A0A6N8IXA6_9BURK|nr:MULTISPECIES: outer membrane protein assembly factor BamE [Ramlibacter]MBA2965640.1 outer membrane protein assembly factor BamE [Ramlibacter sp. CGMCC 1.13660]MVQ30606.1 outer membrane protein assembly factor BamE [Ramlibacter pinisoli]
MPPRTSRFLRPGLVLAACALGAGCASVDNATRPIANAITPYKVEVVQGNFVSSEQVELLKPGMSRQQVRELLGTPLLTSVFHADRWDYVFTLRRQGVEPQRRKLTVFFKGEGLEHFEGDSMPSEADFVASIGSKRALGKVPVLEATEDQLKRNSKPAAPEAAPAPAPEPPLPASYPPLETTGR